MPFNLYAKPKSITIKYMYNKGSANNSIPDVETACEHF